MSLGWHNAESIKQESWTCGYCGHEVAGSIGYRREDDEDDRKIYICPYCENPTAFIYEEFGYPEQFPKPVMGNEVTGLPESVESVYNEARRCIQCAAYTSAALALRKLLMHVAVEQGAAPKLNDPAVWQGRSTAKDGRPELDKILYKPDELPAHEAVIVFKNDRIARDTKLYFYYLYVLEKRNVKLISTQEQFAEGDDFANIYRSLLMFVAEQERKNIALRTGKGRSLKARCGGYAGGNKPYGYTVSSGTLVINPKEEPIVETVFREHDEEDATLEDICESLSELGYKTRKGKRFQPSTVRGILSNRKFYEGMYRYGDMSWVKGAHAPILPLEVKK